MILSLIERYGINWTSIDNGQDEWAIQGELPDGNKYSLYLDRVGNGTWELFDGRRRHSGETDPNRVEEVAFSVLLCLYGIREKHPELKSR